MRHRQPQNPAKYNGYKVYGADGCQITLEVAAKILAAIEAVDCFAVQPADFDAALAECKIEYSSEKCLDDFVDAVYAQRVGDGASTADLKLVYTPLNGSGLECVKKLLAKLGITHVTVVPEQEKPDGNLPTCPYPNPEIREAMQKGLELCDTVHPDLLLGTDPEEGDVLSVADFALPLQDTALANLQSESSTLWYAARRLNEGMDADAAAALNALWEKLV